jgi:hypothetical protein
MYGSAQGTKSLGLRANRTDASTGRSATRMTVQTSLRFL